MLQITYWTPLIHIYLTHVQIRLLIGENLTMSHLMFLQVIFEPVINDQMLLK